MFTNRQNLCKVLQEGGDGINEPIHYQMIQYEFIITYYLLLYLIYLTLPILTASEPT